MNHARAPAPPRRALSWLAALVLVLAPLPRAGAEFGDILFPRKVAGASEYPPATFPHFVHRMQFKCYVCHDSIFQMKAGADEITMEAISAGRFCGRCHDGKTAFAVTFEACLRCHKSGPAP